MKTDELRKHAEEYAKLDYPEASDRAEWSLVCPPGRVLELLDELQALRTALVESPAAAELMKQMPNALRLRADDTDELTTLRARVSTLEKQLALTNGVSDNITMMLVDFELMKSCLAKHATETGYCLFCQQNGHHKDCPIGKLDS